MDDVKKQRLASISAAIDEAQRKIRQAKRDIASATEDIAKLDRERWQLILTE
jgi:chromosome segregation ATPase